MKKLTCKEIGGPCDAVLTAETQDEMMQTGWQHLEEAHPEMADDIKKMGPNDPRSIEWKKSFDKAWNEAPSV